MQPGAVAADFTLTERDGFPFDSAALRGKVWLASVFFANCPGPCFRENQALADILRNIPDPDFMVVSVTCDPDNDTPDALRRYADRFQADPERWKFLTGDMASIKKIANETFLLPAEVGVHSERGVVFDRQGRLRGSYHLLQPDRVRLLEQLIRDVLAEPAETEEAAAGAEQAAAGPGASVPAGAATP
jgi:cytochrome oxidase Cu insertion factor (SCO1/SenC/PrrC family)